MYLFSSLNLLSFSWGFSVNSCIDFKMWKFIFIFNRKWVWVSVHCGIETMLKLFFCEIIFLLFSQLYYYPEIVLQFFNSVLFLGNRSQTYARVNFITLLSFSWIFCYFIYFSSVQYLHNSVIFIKAPSVVYMSFLFNSIEWIPRGLCRTDGVMWLKLEAG